MRPVFLVVVLCAACGDNLGAGDDVIGDDAPARSWSRDVVYSGPWPIAAAEVQSDGRIAVLEAEPPSDDAPRCPDCETMQIPDDECPAVCARAILTLQWVEADGALGARVPIDRFAIGPSAEMFGSATVAEVDGGLDLAWTRCLGAPNHSCATYQGRLDATGFTPDDASPVLAPRVGSVTLVSHPDGGRSLVRGWPDPYPFSLPIRVEVMTDGAAPLLAGSSEALMPSPSITATGAYLFVEDRSPDIVEQSCPPCESFVDCATGAWPPPGSDCVWGATPQGGLARIDLLGSDLRSVPVIPLPRGDGVILKVEQLAAGSGAFSTALIDAEERGILLAQERDDGWHVSEHAAEPRFWFQSRGTGWVEPTGAMTVPGFEFPSPFPPGFEYAAPIVEIRRYEEDGDAVEYRDDVHLGPVMGQSPVRPIAGGALATAVILAEKSDGSEAYDRWVVWRLRSD